jgi:nucleoid DNA-binding protein
MPTPQVLFRWKALNNFLRRGAVTMNRADLIEGLRNSLALTIYEAGSAANVIFDILSGAIAKGENVELRGLGTFSVKQVKEKKILSPK